LEEKLEKLRFSYFNPKDKNLKIIEAVEGIFLKFIFYLKFILEFI